MMSGLIVETTVTLEGDMLVLHTPRPECAKRWISNGLVADWGVVVARLLVHGKDLGPHALVVPMDAPGVRRSNMEPKVAFNGLDNALIEFDRVMLPRSSLLAATLDADGTYRSTLEGGVTGFLQVAQRLLSGRICLAGGALGTLRQVLGFCCATRPSPSSPLSQGVRRDGAVRCAAPDPGGRQPVAAAGAAARVSRHGAADQAPLLRAHALRGAPGGALREREEAVRGRGGAGGGGQDRVLRVRAAVVSRAQAGGGLVQRARGVAVWAPPQRGAVPVLHALRGGRQRCAVPEDCARRSAGQWSCGA